MAGEVNALLKLQRGNPEVRQNLDEVIYGKHSRARFDNDGKVEPTWKCGVPQNGRSVLCHHHKRGSGWDGCFSESLVGTIICICTPGKKGNSIASLCGANITQYRGTWWGSTHTLEDKKSLFKEVWNTTIQKCLVESKSNRHGARGWERLEKSLTEIKNNLTPGKIGKITYLGGNAAGSCIGIDETDVCVAYPGKGKDNVKIPWLEKIEETVRKFHQRVTEKHLTPAPAETGPAEPSAAPMLAAEIADQAIQPQNAPHVADGQPENEELETETSESTKSSEEAPKSRRKRSTTTTPNPSPTDTPHIPHIATDPTEDGSLLTLQKWLLLTVIFN
ncbi:unnamed protein product [Trypanosoma congolense IL3000]|uniref:WGS project CAEQ00000000 data, annotated contig 1148 n=1 Tax=Trypanosoma congolense (strain IL3000) TaxID=1068625 RepID=F9W457_TRYCI|nr:unnamed protein product [Trypanosoma congolense IL3000]